MQVILEGQETVLPKSKHEDDVFANSHTSRMFFFPHQNKKRKETKEIIKQKVGEQKRGLIHTSLMLMSILADLKSS